MNRSVLVLLVTYLLIAGCSKHEKSEGQLRPTLEELHGKVVRRWNELKVDESSVLNFEAFGATEVVLLPAHSNAEKIRDIGVTDERLVEQLAHLSDERSEECPAFIWLNDTKVIGHARMPASPLWTDFVLSRGTSSEDGIASLGITKRISDGEGAPDVSLYLLNRKGILEE